MKASPFEYLKSRGQIYILPTKMGGYFNGLIFLMFLLSVGYNSNLLLIFTLFLFGLNLLWVIQTHFHLKELGLKQLSVQDGHAFEAVSFSLAWDKFPPGLHQWSMRLECENHHFKLRPLVEQVESVQGEIIWQDRGLQKWRYLYVETSRPFGLYRAFRYFRVASRSCVYPGLLKQWPLTSLSGLGGVGESPTGIRGEGDFLELLAYSNDEARKISWKHYARTGELLVREGEEEKASLAEFKWTEDIPDKEEALKRLATQMVFCHRQNIPFSFEMGPIKRGPESGVRHLSRCLEDLALC